MAPLSRAGYTLIELVTVTALAVLLFSLAVGTYFAWTSGAALDAAQRTVLSALGRGRAFALAQGTETRFVGLPRAAATADEWVLETRPGNTGVWSCIVSTNRLPRGIRFDAASPWRTNITFGADGAARDGEDDDAAWYSLALQQERGRDADGRRRRQVDVNRLTGFSREGQP